MKTCLSILLVAAGVVFASAGPVLALSCTISPKNINLSTIDTLGSEQAASSSTVTVTCQEPNQQPKACLKILSVDPLSNGYHQMAVTLTHDDNGSIPYTSTYSDPILLTQDGSDWIGEIDVHAKVTANPNMSVGTYQVAENITVGVIDDGGDDCSGGLAFEDTETLTIQGDVVADCNIEADDIDFGNVGTLDKDQYATGRVYGECTPGISYQIELNNGIRSDEENVRKMEYNGKYIVYDLYKDKSYSQRWGVDDEELSSNKSESESPGYDYPVYAKLPKQNASKGIYTDTVTATIIYPEVEN